MKQELKNQINRLRLSGMSDKEIIESLIDLIAEIYQQLEEIAPDGRIQ